MKRFDCCAALNADQRYQRGICFLPLMLARPRKIVPDLPAALQVDFLGEPTTGNLHLVEKRASSKGGANVLGLQKIDDIFSIPFGELKEKQHVSIFSAALCAADACLVCPAAPCLYLVLSPGHGRADGKLYGSLYAAVLQAAEHAVCRSCLWTWAYRPHLTLEACHTAQCTAAAH